MTSNQVPFHPLPRASTSVGAEPRGVASRCQINTRQAVTHCRRWAMGTGVSCAKLRAHQRATLIAADDSRGTCSFSSISIATVLLSNVQRYRAPEKSNVNPMKICAINLPPIRVQPLARCSSSVVENSNMCAPYTKLLIGFACLFSLFLLQTDWVSEFNGTKAVQYWRKKKRISNFECVEGCADEYLRGSGTLNFTSHRVVHRSLGRPSRPRPVDK